MRVIINQQPAIGQRTGVGCYAYELLRHLRLLENAIQVDGFPNSWERHIVRGWSYIRPYFEPRIPEDDGPVKKETLANQLRRRTISSIRRSGRAFMGWRLRKICRKRHYDIYHETNYVPFPVNCPTVTTVCDLSVLLHPQWHPAERVRHFEKLFISSLGLSQHFIAISQFTRAEMIRHLGLSPEAVSVTYMGYRPELRPMSPMEVAAALQRLGLPARFLLYLGTLEPRKNVLRLLQVYCSLPDAIRQQYPLLLVGRWGWKAKPIADYLHDVARHRGVIQAGYIPDCDLPAIYNAAHALIYPSYYEGFGLPPLEMMACGGAVITSTAGALNEMFGHQAHLVDPSDDDGWRAAILRVCTDHDFQRTLCHNAVQQAQKYTWNQCALDTLRIYQSLLNQPAKHFRKAA